MTRFSMKSLLALCLALCMVMSLLSFAPLRASAVELSAPDSEEESVEVEATEPEATEPEATEPEATEPEATEPEATEPVATEPEATEPEATEPVATEPEATEPVATEPVATEPVATEPVATEPVTTEPVATEPVATEPVATEPVATEPVATEPVATEPVATEPVTTEPVATEPVTTEPVATEPEDEADEPEADEPADITDEDVLSVIELLKGIDSLQEMQNKRKTITVKTVYADAEEEHKAAQQQYKEYVDGMFEKRAAAKAAYDALTDEQKEQVRSDEEAAAGLAKLDPYDRLANVFPLTGDYPIAITPSTNEYSFEVVRAYELSQNITGDKDFPCTLVLVDVSGDATSWSPNGLYQYGQSNYEMTYCIDLREPTTHGWHYKRINLEDCEYYTKSDASHIRAIILASYPFISMEEMKSALIAGGYNAEYANALTRSDIIAAVQQAIWAYANRSNMENIEASIVYGGTGEIIDYPYASRRLITTIHDYRNELWDWYNTGFNYAARYPTYYPEIEARVNSLTQYLCDLPGVEAPDDQIIITDVTVARSSFIEGSDDTYSLDLNIFLNHGTADGDVTITITSSSTGESGETITSTKTIEVKGASKYEVNISAKYGDTVKVVVDGTQKLPKGVYFYEPEGGYDKSQALVGIGEGETRVHAENSFVFEKDIDMGLRVFKTTEETQIPISNITFDVYRVEIEEGATLSGKPTAEEIGMYAKDENLAGSLTTDSTGYGFLALEEGTYLVVEKASPKVKAPADPFYVTIPTSVEVVDEDGNVTVEHQDIVAVHVENTPADAPDPAAAVLEVTKEFKGRDWEENDAFTFRLEAVTENAPLPENTYVTATKDAPIAVFDSISFKKIGTYEYRISEVSGRIPGVTYDLAVHKVLITVAKAADGSNKLVANVSYDGAPSLTITNTFTPVEAAPEVTKLLEGRDWEDDDSFTFQIEAVTEGAPMPAETTATATKAAPVAVFDSISFEKLGTYEYCITEVNGGIPGISYDISVHQVIVTVSRASSGNALVAEITYDGTSSLVVTNRFTPAEAEIEVTKLLEGRDWEDDDSFTFQIEAVTEGAPIPAETTAIATKDAVTASFGTITFVKAGTYEYTITEAEGSLQGVTYDLTAHKAVVTVTKDEENNKLIASVAYDDGAESLAVTNRFDEPTPAEAEIEVTKALEGRDWNEDDAFAFLLEAVTEGAPMPEVTAETASMGNHTAVFGPISFAEAGTYEYSITEVDGGIPGITYDITAHKVIITVTLDEEANELIASVTYDGAASLTVTNTYFEPAPAEAAFEVTKAISGREWKNDDSFSFRLDAVTEGLESIPMPMDIYALATKNEQTAVFGTILFPQAGTFEYTITEIDGGIEGVTYDITAHKVIVTITLDEESKALVASVTYDGAASLTVTNRYTEPSIAEAALEVTKAIDGREWLEDDAFSFQLTAVTEGAPMPAETTATATKDATTAKFDTITFTEAGTFEYTIAEINGGIEGVTYDLTAHKAVVTVAEDAEGKRLIASVSYDDGAESLTVTNRYTVPTPAEAIIEVSKALSGRAWTDDDSFTFRLEAVTEGAPMPAESTAIAVRSKPTASFGRVSFNKIGTYVYRITETSGTIPGVVYDHTAHQVIVTVSRATDGSNKLVSSVSYDGSDHLTVTNTYQPTPVSVDFGGKKTISGKTTTTPTFTFTLTETTAGASYKDTATVKGSGTFSFKTITYSKAGVHTYEITEVKGTAAGWIYDTKKYTVTVTVTDDGNGNLSAAVSGLNQGVAEFKNVYDPSRPPTGDDSHLLGWSLAALASLAALSYLGIRLKKRRG